MSDNLTLERPAVESPSSAAPSVEPSLIPKIDRAQMTGVIARATAMLTSPAAEWKVIAAEPGGLREAFVPYGIVMALLPAVALLGQGLFWSTYATAFMGPFGASTTFASFGTWAVRDFAETLVSFLIGGKIMELLAPKFNAKADWVKSCRILIYASTPWAVASLARVIPLLGATIAWVAGFWSLALAYQGYQILLENKPSSK